MVVLLGKMVRIHHSMETLQLVVELVVLTVNLVLLVVLVAALVLVFIVIWADLELLVRAKKVEITARLLTLVLAVAAVLAPTV